MKLKKGDQHRLGTGDLAHLCEYVGRYRNPHYHGYREVYVFKRVTPSEACYLFLGVIPEVFCWRNELNVKLTVKFVGANIQDLHPCHVIGKNKWSLDR